MHIIKKTDSEGFTLIELLIVIIIIGILAAIAFVAFSGATNKAHKSDAQATIGQVKTKLGEYYATNNSYPADIGSVDNWLASSAGGNNNTMSTTFTTANHYTYAVTPTGCGDTVASGGAITAGSSACTGFTLTAQATIWGGTSPTDDITVTN